MDTAKLLGARLRAASELPYLASALYSLTVVVTEAVPTMGVDRHWRCYVSPTFVDSTPVAELAGVWIHEVSHLLRDHPGRADRLSGEPRQRVNLAQDCEINDDLLDVEMPPFTVRPLMFGMAGGKLFEEYLRLLPPQPNREAECGSGAHGQPTPWETDGPVNRVNETEAAAIRRATAQEMRAHHRSRGDLPRGWLRWAEETLEPVVDWRRALTGAVREAAAWASGAVDYTYHRPSRRGAAQRQVVLPSLRRPMPRVAIVVDTSGSMGSEQLTAVLAEVSGVLRAVGVGRNRVTVLACDADVHAVRQVNTVGEVALLGGGGTDMRVGIAAALTVARPPHIVIVLTDGWTPWPQAPTRTRVIAGLIGADAPTPPAWIETIPIPA